MKCTIEFEVDDEISKMEFHEQLCFAINNEDPEALGLLNAAVLGISYPGESLEDYYDELDDEYAYESVEEDAEPLEDEEEYDESYYDNR